MDTEHLKARIKELEDALFAAEDALRNSAPTHRHYAETVKRHEAAHRQVMAALEPAIRSPKPAGE